MTKIPLFILVGPTAVGKTELSINLAKNLNGEIISADSMQIYKYMDIGTAKIQKEEMEGIPHYLINIIYPNENFTVSNYRSLASSYIKNIYNKNKLPIIVGGTGLYINSLVYDLNFTRVPPNKIFREKYINIADNKGNSYIHQKLAEIDPVSAKRINLNDRKRIIRALEIYKETGKPMSAFYKNFRKINKQYDTIMIGLIMDRKELYERINKRVDIMIENGLIEEVKKILNMGYDKNLNSMKALGYKEIINYLENKTSLDESINLIKRNSRRFAKRQLTWFRRDNRIKWINKSKFDNKNQIYEYIIEYVKNHIQLTKGGNYFEG